MKKKIYLFVSFILILFIACGAKKGTKAEQMESKLDKSVDVGMLKYNKADFCYFIKYKYIIDYNGNKIPIFGGTSKIVEEITLKNYDKNLKNDNYGSSPKGMICLPVQKGGYSTIMDVLQFYQKEGFIKDIGEMDILFNTFWDQGNGDARGNIHFQNQYDKEYRFGIGFEITIPNYKKYNKNEYFSDRGYYKVEDKKEERFEYIKRLDKLPIKNNMMKIFMGVGKVKDKE